MVDGREQDLVYLHRLRVDPAMQGKGLHAIINFYSMATAPEEGGTPYGFIASENHRMLESVSARREHDRALAIYKSSLKILQTTLARS